MFCKKCGRLIEDGAQFCSGCGTAVENQVNQIQNSPVSNNLNEAKVQTNTQHPIDAIRITNTNYVQENSNYNNEQNQNYDNIINPSMKKYAIWSIIIPTISLFVYFFIGLSFYVAILLAGLGFNFAKKGKLYSKKMATVGVVLNTILTIVSVLMLILLIIGAIS